MSHARGRRTFPSGINLGWLTGLLLLSVTFDVILTITSLDYSMIVVMLVRIPMNRSVLPRLNIEVGVQSSICTPLHIRNLTKSK